MSKQYLSKADFLAGITCQPVDFEVEGLGLIRVRSLTTLESGELSKRHAGDGIAMMLGAVRICLVEPALDESEHEQLGRAQPGIIQAIGQRIMELSGLVETKAQQEELEKKAGNGS